MFKLFMTFIIKENGVEIFLPPFHLIKIPGNQIGNVRILDVEESKQVFEDSIKDQFALKEEMDITGYVRLLRKKTPAFKYLSVAPIATLTSKGQMEHLNSLNCKIKRKNDSDELMDGGSRFQTCPCGYLFVFN